MAGEQEPQVSAPWSRSWELPKKKTAAGKKQELSKTKNTAPVLVPVKTLLIFLLVI